MANEPSKTDNPDDAKLSGPREPAQKDAGAPAVPIREATPSHTTDQSAGDNETKSEPFVSSANEPTHTATFKETPAPPAQPPQPQPVPEAPRSANYSGVLVEQEIKDLKLIRVPEPNRDEQRCYQPTSYDLRLGAEYVMPSRDGQLVIRSCMNSGMLTIEPFATSIVSTYESVALPSNVVGRFNLRVQHAFEGLMVQMGTQVEPNYEGQLFALLHNISDHPKTLKFRDYDTRPFTIEFSYTSQPARPPEPRKKQRKKFSDFIPPNYARGGLNLVIENLRNTQSENKRLSQAVHSNKLLWFTGIFLLIIVTAATILIPFALAKFTYDKDYFPLVSADAIAAMKYGPNHSNDADIVKQIMRELDARSSGAGIVPREQFYAERLVQLKNRRDSIKGNPAQAAELKSIEKQIDEIVELLKK